MPMSRLEENLLLIWILFQIRLHSVMSWYPSPQQFCHVAIVARSQIYMNNLEQTNDDGENLNSWMFELKMSQKPTDDIVSLVYRTVSDE